MESNQNTQNINQMGHFSGSAFKMPNMEEFSDDEMDFSNPFDHMMQQMSFPSLGSHFRNFFNDEGFDHVEHKTLQTGGPGKGTIISKSYVSQTRYNKDGKPERESYQTQSINQLGEDGHRIQEKQEAYKNSLSGIEKAAHQRMLDGKGHKYIKERNKKTGDHKEHHLYKGMQEGELNDFNNQYNDYRQKVGFQKNYELLGQIGGRKRLGKGGYNGMANINMLGNGGDYKF